MSSQERAFLIYPNQLFPLNQLFSLMRNADLNPKEFHFFLLEDPYFFGTKKRISNFNQVKLVLHRASMKYYYDELRKSKTAKTIKYLNYAYLTDSRRKSYSFLQSTSDVHCFDPTDHAIEKELKKNLKDRLHIHDTPNFINTRAELQEYYVGKKSKKQERYFHKSFYQWQLKKFPELGIKKSYDTLNRKPLPKNIDIPELPRGDEQSKYVKEAIRYVKKHFPNNYGNADQFRFPIKHDTAEKWLDNFLKKRLSKFGTYQDAISEEDPFLFHSCLSPAINIGIINPCQIVERVHQYYEKHKSAVGKNNFEGYIRQLIGWREYERFLYLFADNEIRCKNYFHNQRKLTKAWYEGTTGVLPVDTAIKEAFQYGYLHHINRLMVMGNFMNLARIHPDEAYRWFMEFALDSYDWVMVGNVYSMAFYADGGLTMRKPYISSDNYVEKMSDYPKGEWNQIWSDLFYYFLDKNEKELGKTVYARNIGHWKKKSKKEQDEIRKRAKKFIDEKTKT